MYGFHLHADNILSKQKASQDQLARILEPAALRGQNDGQVVPSGI